MIVENLQPSPGALRAASVVLPDDLEQINRHYREQQWSDGLPIVPPTAARVDRMITASGLAKDTVVASIAPSFGRATIEAIAINAVMAGCDPEVMPVLIATVQALPDPALNLQALQVTTNPVCLWVIVGGPAAQRLGFNARINALGEGNWANLSLGRALRLILRNVGGALPGQMDRAQHGQPGRIAMCCAENEADSPWPSLREEMGYGSDESLVTLVSVEGTLNMNTHTRVADELLRTFALTLMHPASNEYVGGGEPWLIVGPEHACVIQQAGYDKAEVRRRLWELSKMPADYFSVRDFERAQSARLPDLGEITRDSMIPISPRPEDIRLLVAGGPGTHSVYVPGFAGSRAVTRRVDLPLA